MACTCHSTPAACQSLCWPEQRVRRWPACSLTPKSTWHAFYRHATLLACGALAPLSVTEKSLCLAEVSPSPCWSCRRRAQLPPGFVAATDQACLLQQQAAEAGTRLITLFERFMRVRPSLHLYNQYCFGVYWQRLPPITCSFLLAAA